jgi:hypothetical protein
MNSLISSCGGVLVLNKRARAAVSTSPRGMPNIIDDFGAVGDGVTDDSPAYMRGLTSGQRQIFCPFMPLGYRLSQGIVISGTTVLHGIFTGPGDGTAGTILRFDNDVPICVEINGGASNSAPGLRGFVVTRAGAEPPLSSVGVYVTSCYNVVIEDVMSMNHAKCWRWYANGVTGLSSMLTRIFSSAATDVHIEIDSWPELRFSQCRFGKNGLGDVACNAYVRITGGEFPTEHRGIGPNTIFFENTQFNQGANQVGRWVTFDDVRGGGSTAVIFNFITCHVEAVAYGIGSNSGTSAIVRAMMTNITISAQNDFLALDPATILSEVQIANSEIFTNLTLDPNLPVNALIINGCRISGQTALTGNGGSTAELIGNHYGTGLTLAGSWTGLSVLGGRILGGNLICTASGVVAVIMENTIILNDGPAGNPRGSNAIDWQGVRVSPTQIASGEASVISGGDQNTASGNRGVVGGGTGGAASGDYSWVPGGLLGQTRNTFGRGAWSSGRFATTGDAQCGEFVFRAQTTDASEVYLTSNQAELGPNNIVVLPTNSSYSLAIMVVARDSLGDSANWTLNLLVKTALDSAEASIVGRVNAAQRPNAADPNAEAWLLTVLGTTDGLVLVAQGQNGQTINWVARVMSVEVVCQ